MQRTVLGYEHVPFILTLSVDEVSTPDNGSELEWFWVEPICNDTVHRAPTTMQWLSNCLSRLVIFFDKVCAWESVSQNSQPANISSFLREIGKIHKIWVIMTRYSCVLPSPFSLTLSFSRSPSRSGSHDHDFSRGISTSKGGRLVWWRKGFFRLFEG